MTEKSIFYEKRAYPRVAVEIPIKCRLMEDSMMIGSITERRKMEVGSKSVDVSLGGMCLVLEQRLEVGTVMSIQFSFDHIPTNFYAFAEVVWVKEDNCGIRFLALKEKDEDALRSALEKVSARG